MGAGLDLNFGIGGKVNAIVTYEPANNTPPYTVNEEYKQQQSNDVGIVLQTGFKLNNGFFTAFNYSVGYLDVNRFSTKDDYGNIYTRNIAVKVGYLFSPKFVLFKKKA